MALKSAEISGLQVPKSAYDGAIAWLDEVTDRESFKVGYTEKGSGKKPRVWSRLETVTAIGMLCRAFIKKDKEDPMLKGGLGLLVQDLPTWDNGNADDRKIDFCYWLWGSQALFQYDGPNGESWKKWNEAMKTALIPNQKQKKDGCAEGSWDAVDVDRWGFEGGRVYATAINTLTLETYYRYAPVFGARKREGK
jgi:hypothetical protein